jgi:cytochrome o ubiquinol oxidase subunit 3
VSEANANQDKEDPYRLGRRGGSAQGVTGHGQGGPAPQNIVTSYGFWIFLLSDIIMFSAFFAAYAVLVSRTAGGPRAAELFEQPRTIAETTCLLFSSFTAGLAAVAAKRSNIAVTELCLCATGVLGLAFLALEVGEFRSLIAQGAGPQRSAFLSAFFALVGCHGLHVFGGLLWMGTMMAQILVKGFKPEIKRRLACFNLFWHALDIVWVAIFTFVYLMGIKQ